MSHTNLKFLDEKLTQDRDYWLQKLSGEAALTGLPLDYPRPAEFDPRRETANLEIAGETQRRLLQICGNNESLVFTFLVTALKIYLHKITGAADITVGTTIHERHREVSSLNKVLALRERVGGGLTVKELLHGVKRTVAEAYAHQKYPFDRLVDLLNAAPADNRAPLFGAAVILENINDPANLKHLRHDLTLSFSLAGGALGGRIEYNPTLFKRESVELFGEQYKRVLWAALDTPDLKVEEIELLSPEKRHELLFDFNDTAAEYPLGQPAHRLFEQQAALRPDSAAVHHGAGTLTFAGLNS
ncbi:MAG: condensation domain-containing protein, partial [Pyrinomonadaceae bacterium]